MSDKLATTAIASVISKPDPTTEAGQRFRQGAADMTEVLLVAATTPDAIVCWEGVPRRVGDLRRAWAKLAMEAERKRLGAR